MKKYTTYDDPFDRIFTGKDTRTIEEWETYYNKYVDHAEYPEFSAWLYDMLKMGILIPEK